MPCAMPARRAGDRAQQRIGEFAADRGVDLRDRLDRRQPIETRRQRILQCRRNGEGRQWLVEAPATRPLARPGARSRRVRSGRVPRWRRAKARSRAPRIPGGRKLAELAMGDERSSLFGAGNVGVLSRGGRLYRRDADESRSESYADLLSRAGLAEIEGHGSAGGDTFAEKPYAMYAHGAVFAEVKVDPDLGQVRATRLVGACAAGTVINPRLVRSQYYGGMIWGVSFALHEAALLDPRSGRVMNANLAEYHIPVNADVPSLEAILVEENDPHVNALGIKGVGEIGITGSAGAVA